MARYRSGGTPWVVILDRDSVVRYNGFHSSVDHADKLISTLLQSPPVEDSKTGRSSRVIGEK